MYINHLIISKKKLLGQKKGFFSIYQMIQVKKCNNQKIDKNKEYIIIESFFNLSKSKKDKKVFLVQLIYFEI